MADMIPLKSRLTFGAYTITQGETIATVPLVSKLTINPVSWFNSPAKLLVPPLRTKMSFGRYRWVQHSTPLTAESPSNYNGTTYEVTMTGGHAGLPDILIPAESMSADEGGVKVSEAIVVQTPDGQPHGTALGGVLGATDYGADTPQVGESSAIQGAPIESIVLVDDAAGNVYSTVFFGGSQKILRHLITGSSVKLIAVLPFIGPHISQLRAVPGEGFVAITDGGFYFLGALATPNTHRARNSGIANPGGGRLSLLADGSLIVYVTADMRAWKTVDLGLHWTSVQANLPVESQQPRDVYVATATHWWVATTAGVWKTTNGGTSWISGNGNLEAQVGTFSDDSGLFSVHGLASAPNSVVIGLRGKVARTTNGGSTWTLFGPTEGLGTKPARYRVHQAGSVLLAAYGEFYEERPNGYVWRSEDNGASWQAAFTGPAAPCVNDIATAVGFSSDLAVIATPKAPPDKEEEPWVPTEVGHQVSINRSSLVTVTTRVDPATLSAIAARMVTVDNKKARLIIRQVKDYRTQKYYQVISSGEYQSMARTNSSLVGLVALTLTAKDTNVKQSRTINKVARVIDPGVVVGLEGEGADITVSMLIDETFVPYTKISWLSTEYVVSGIKYAMSGSARIMSLNTAVRVFAVPTSPARAGITKRIPVVRPPRVTAKASQNNFVGGSTRTFSAG